LRERRRRCAGPLSAVARQRRHTRHESDVNDERDVNVAAIDALLPQTQCTRCGHDGCRPYAEAIAAKAADINQCPPGGARTIEALAQLLERPVLPLNPANGVEQPERVAVIDESRCIGCA